MIRTITITISYNRNVKWKDTNYTVNSYYKKRLN